MADWISSFLDYTSGLPSPENFRLWAGITAVSGILERRCWVETAQSQIFPNIFTLLVGPPATGKCLSPDEHILAYNGKSILTGHVQLGDTLMGPDGEKRTVLAVHPGKGQMYEIRPYKGRSWKCNGSHILSLKKSRNPGAGEICHVTVDAYRKWTPWQKSNWKLWKTGVKNFEQQNESLVDPYFIGLMLGDGDELVNGVTITSNDFEIVEYVRQLALDYNLDFLERNNMRYALVGKTYHSNWLLTELRSYGMHTKCENKHVPENYRTASYETRRQVLAGLMDTDGSYDKNSEVFDFISKSKQLALDVAFLARSLGLSATVKQSVKSTGSFVGLYWRTTIGGKVEIIPCRIKRKQPKITTKRKDALVSGFLVVPCGEELWYGLTVDKDNQYLLDDFTVIHNSQAVSPVTNLWYASQQVFVSPDNVTAASLVDALEEADRKLQFGSGMLEYHALAVACSELGVLIPAHDLAFMSILNHIYDNPPTYREKRRTLNKESDIIRPQLTILAGTQPGFMASLFPEEAWSMGFTSRIIMVYSGAIPKVDLFDNVRPSPATFKQLTADLVELSKPIGELSFTADAKAAIRGWQAENYEPVPQHSKLEHYNGRRILHVLKLSIISCISRTQGMLIEHEDVIRAMDWLLTAERGMPDIFRQMTGRSDQQILQELHFHMFHLYEKEKKPIHQSRLLHFLSAHTTSDKVFKILEMAEKSKMLLRVPGTELFNPRPKSQHGQE